LSANQLVEAKLPPLIIIGLQKTGQIVDHIHLFSRFTPENSIPENSVFALDDEYRYRYVCTGREQAKNGFGAETYYGQDFICNTSSNRKFVFALPYPCPDKSSLSDFKTEKTNLQLYTELPAHWHLFIILKLTYIAVQLFPLLSPTSTPQLV
jgi:hypothetical protein